MADKIQRSIETPIRERRLDFDDRWNAPDGGLILCWETGRRMSDQQPDLAAKAKNGELPVLAWQGGVAKKLKDDKHNKLGTWYYLATWQGLRGEDLDITRDGELSLTCAKTGQTVLFSSRVPVDEEEADEP